MRRGFTRPPNRALQYKETKQEKVMSKENKLPVIGKRYKENGIRKRIYKCISVKIDEESGEKCVILHSEDGTIGTHHDLKTDFWNDFEELPDQEPTKEKDLMQRYTEKVTMDRALKKESKIQEALEELKEVIKDAKEVDDFLKPKGITENIYQSVLLKLKETSQNLVNAIEEKQVEIKCTKCGENVDITREHFTMLGGNYSHYDCEDLEEKEYIPAKNGDRPLFLDTSDHKLYTTRKAKPSSEPSKQDTLRDWCDKNYDLNLGISGPDQLIDIISEYLERKV